MATPNEFNIIRGWSGRVVHTPTDLNAAYPHGGVELGIVSELRFIPAHGVWSVSSEAWGGQLTEFGYSGEEARLLCILRELDADMVDYVFPNTSVGAVSGRRVIEQDASGAQMLTPKILYFAADDVDDQDSILIYNAVPQVSETAEIQLQASIDIGIPLIFHGTPRAPDLRVYRIGRRKDLASLLA